MAYFRKIDNFEREEKKTRQLKSEIKLRLANHRSDLINYLRVLNREKQKEITDYKVVEYYDKEILNAKLIITIIEAGLENESMGFSRTLERFFGMSYERFRHLANFGYSFKMEELSNIISYIEKRPMPIKKITR